MKLYELTSNYQNLWSLVDDETMDLSMIETALTTIEGEIQEKSTNIAQFIKSLESDADIIKAEEKRLADRRKAIENKTKWLKGYIQTQLEAAGIDKIKTPTFTLAIQNNPPSVQIQDETLIPAEYLTIIPQTYQVDKNRVKEAIKNGIDVPGATLAQGKSLRIR